MAEHGWRTLAVTSPTADADAAAVAVNLAGAIAADPRHHALLVDLDLRSPRIALLLGLDAAAGVETVLAGAGSIAGCLWRTDEFPRLAFVPVAKAVPRAAELVTGAAAARLFAELRDRYPDRIIVYSLPPVLGSDDLLAFLPSVECALLVVAEGRTKRADVAESMRLLRRTPVVGTVLGSSAAAGRSSE
jgi:protein-tyrosine kinase